MGQPIRMTKLNLVQYAPTEERAAELEARGYRRDPGGAKPEGSGPAKKRKTGKGEDHGG